MPQVELTLLDAEIVKNGLFDLYLRQVVKEEISPLRDLIKRLTDVIERIKADPQTSPQAVVFGVGDMETTVNALEYEQHELLKLIKFHYDALKTLDQVASTRKKETIKLPELYGLLSSGTNRHGVRWTRRAVELLVSDIQHSSELRARFGLKEDENGDVVLHGPEAKMTPLRDPSYRTSNEKFAEVLVLIEMFKEPLHQLLRTRVISIIEDPHS
jgi:hypothetical protein